MYVDDMVCESADVVSTTPALSLNKSGVWALNISAAKDSDSNLE